jgi:GTP pyrophosphokinase
LGLLHSRFTPVPGGFRDYVALSRPNRYRALHTAVVDRSGVPMELQIRSRVMDEVAEHGILATGPTTEAWELRKLEWISQLMDWQSDITDPNEFIAAVKADLFADEVYVFTPKGDIYTFPKGATPIDFAFAIHTDIGMHCSGARVNGQVVPLRYRLRQGDRVEILTNPNYGPGREWLELCATSRARARVKHYLRQQERNRLRELGRNLVEQELATRGLVALEARLDELVSERAEAFGLAREQQGPEGVYTSIGAGELQAAHVVDRLAPESNARPEKQGRNMLTRMLSRMAGSARMPRKALVGATEPLPARDGRPFEITRERLGLRGKTQALVQLAPCCSPVPGDALVGFFEAGEGIVAHVQGCPEALEQLSERRIQLAWAEGMALECPVLLEVRSANRVGLLAEMSRVFSSEGVNIKQANCRALDEGDGAVNTFKATVRTLDQLEALMGSLRNIEGVTMVERLFSRDDELC